MTKRTHISIAVFSASMIIASSSYAYELYSCAAGDYYRWDSGQVIVWLDTSDWTEGSDTHEALEDLVVAYSYWNNFPGTDLYTQHGNRSSTTWLNGYSEMRDVESGWIWSHEAPGVTRWSANAATCNFLERDVLFNEVDFTFTDDTPGWPGTGANIDIQTSHTESDDYTSRPAVAIHELGHVAGLDHETDYPDTMNAIYPGLQYSDFQAYPEYIEFRVQENARQGIRYLYPDDTTGTDLSIGNWRWGKYESSSNNGWIQCHPGEFNSQIILTYDQGDPIEYWAYYLNEGTEDVEDVWVGIFLSTNQWISPGSDDLIAYFKFDLLKPNSPALIETTAYIPEWVQSGDYYLGAYIDYTLDIDEYDEGNNSTPCAGSGGYPGSDDPILVTID
jgi:hypothetical protein